MNFEEEYFESVDFESYKDYTEKDKSRNSKRHKDFSKAIARRKKDMSRGESFKEHPWYSDLHRYSKGKIHCSCPLCAFNAKKHGKVVYGKQLPIGDKRRYDACMQQLAEYAV